MDFYEAATDALAIDLSTHSLVALTTLLPAG
jgi:NAD(P)H-quinone oxidoreductase subunit 4